MPTPLWTIRRETIAAFDQLAREQFVDDMVARLGVDFPEQRQELMPAGMVRAVEHGIAAAAEYQVVAAADVADFLQLWFRSGHNPERRWPWFAKLLENRALSPRVRLELVEKSLAAVSS